MSSNMQSQDVVTVPPSPTEGVKLVYMRSHLGEFKLLLGFHAYVQILSFMNFNIFLFKNAWIPGGLCVCYPLGFAFMIYQF